MSGSSIASIVPGTKAENAAHGRGRSGKTWRAGQAAIEQSINDRHHPITLGTGRPPILLPLAATAACQPEACALACVVV